MLLATCVSQLAACLAEIPQFQKESLVWIGFSLAIELVVLVRLSILIHKRCVR